MRRTIKTLLFAFFAVITLHCVAATSGYQVEAASTRTVSVKGTQYYNYAFQQLKQTNQLRTKKGVSTLKMDKDLMKAAMQRAAEIAIYFDHTRPNGSSCFTASNKAYGENIATGASSVQVVTNTWNKSPGHRANMLNSSWKSVGIGCFKSGGKLYWVQLFGISQAVTVKQPANKTTWVSVSLSSATPTQNMCATPKIPKVTNTRNGIKVTWSKAKNATGYYVYRKTGTGSWSKIATLKGQSTLSYVDKSTKDKTAKRYSYSIRSYNAAYVSSYNRTGASITRVSTPSLGQCENLTSKRMVVKWSTNKNVTGYQLQYTTSKTFKNKKTITINNNKTATRTIKNLAVGKTYYVRARSFVTIGGKKVYGGWSSAKSIKINK